MFENKSVIMLTMVYEKHKVRKTGLIQQDLFVVKTYHTTKFGGVNFQYSMAGHI